MPAVTLQKIADDLNLSVAAVSAALGTKSTSKVSRQTALRVRVHALKLNYRPSLIGKSMRSRRLKQIGLVVECIFDARNTPIVTTPAIFGLNSFLRDQDWQLNIIEDDGQRTGDALLPRYLREHFLDGVVVSSSSAHRDKVLREDFEKFSIPAVFLNAAEEHNCISINDRFGAALAAHHLLELGHRKLLFVGTDSTHYSMRERSAGFREAVEAKGLPAPLYLPPGMRGDKIQGYENRREYAYQIGRRFVEEQYLTQRPTGIICYDDRVAMILTRGLHDAGVSIPGDVSMVGYNDMPFMDLLTPPLTTVRCDFHALGRFAGRMLLDLIEKNKTHLPSPVINPELVVRQSTRPL